MKILKCSEVGDFLCDFIAEGTSQDEVKQEMFDHYASAHKKELKEMEAGKRRELGKKIDALSA